MRRLSSNQRTWRRAVQSVRRRDCSTPARPASAADAAPDSGGARGEPSGQGFRRYQPPWCKRASGWPHRIIRRRCQPLTANERSPRPRGATDPPPATTPVGECAIRTTRTAGEARSHGRLQRRHRRSCVIAATAFVAQGRRGQGAAEDRNERTRMCVREDRRRQRRHRRSCATACEFCQRPGNGSFTLLTQSAAGQ